MLRSIIALAPALAFALPFVASANPLTDSTDESRWGGGGYEQVQKPHGGGDTDLELMMAVCTTVQVLAEDRACAVLPLDECISACDDAVVAPFTAGACRASCLEDTAAFCDLGARFTPGKKPFKPGKKPAKPGKGQVYPDQGQVYPDQGQVYPDQGQVYPDQLPAKPDHGDSDKLIFINVEQCTAIGINVDTNR